MGVNISQQEYGSKAACEAAITVIDEAVRVYGRKVTTRCVRKLS